MPNLTKRKRSKVSTDKENIVHQGAVSTEHVQKKPKLRTGGRSTLIAERVERATRELLSEGSLSSVTFEAIAERADVNRATLRRRWGDKWRLITWVMLEVMSREAPAPNTGSFREDVLAATLNLNKAFSDRSSAAVFQVLFVESRSDPAIEKAVEEYWQNRFDIFKPIFDRAVERNELPQGANYGFVMDVAFGPFMYHVLRTGKPISVAYANALLDVAMVCLRTQDTGLLNPDTGVRKRK